MSYRYYEFDGEKWVMMSSPLWDKNLLDRAKKKDHEFVRDRCGGKWEKPENDEMLEYLRELKKDYFRRKFQKE